MDFPKEIKSYFPVFDMLARHCVCVYTERGLAHWPNIYCGSAVFVLVPMYLMNGRIRLREKFLRMGLAGFMLLGFGTTARRENRAKYPRLRSRFPSRHSSMKK